MQAFPTESLATDVTRLPTAFVNAYAVGDPNASWVLVDTGLPGFGAYLKQYVEARGSQPPAAIVLTHGHFDHAGNAAELAAAYDIPVYAHRAELPFLDGRSDYPPSDPSMGGAIAQLSRLFPVNGRQLGSRVEPLPEDGSVPHLPNWRWLHTPGHTPGHVALYRESDGLLLAGDALATMDLDSWSAQVTHERKLARSAAPFTSDWDAVYASQRRLAELQPRSLGAGHGRAIVDEPALAGRLASWAQVDRRPRYGRYVDAPARFDAEHGLVSVPPPVADRAGRGALICIGLFVGAGALAALGTLALQAHQRSGADAGPST